MKYRNILVTGGRGFIMFNGLRLWKKMYPAMNFVSLDACTYADRFMLDEKNRWLDENNIPIYTVDLGSEDAPEFLDRIIDTHKIDAVIHAAAESHVDNSIKNPGAFIHSNVVGTQNVLDACRRHDLRLHVVSTDEVYGETTPYDWYLQHSGDEYSILIPPEKKQLVPSSPYSSSKAAADLVALSYVRTFGTRVTVSRCSNNAGPWQHTEKLIGTTISRIMKNEKIPVYGNGGQRRHWIDVDDHNAAIMKILLDGESGRIYNIGPVKENWITNLELIKFILSYMKKPESLIQFVTDRPGHDTSYFIPASIGEFETKPYTEFMPKIIDWYAERINIL